MSYLTLMTEDAPQREYALRDVFNALRYVVKTGCQWQYLPNDFPPWTVVYQQARRWVAAKVFEAIAHDLRLVVRLNDDRSENPSAIILDARRCSRNPKAEVALATMAESVAKDPRFMRPWIRLATCWPCW